MSSVFGFSDLGRRYFSATPSRSYHFVVITIFVLLVAVIPVYITVRLGLGLDMALPIFFPLVVVAMLWYRVWKAHRDVFVAYGTSRVADADSELNTVLNHLAYMLYGGIALALFAVGSAYLGVANVLFRK